MPSHHPVPLWSHWIFSSALCIAHIKRLLKHEILSILGILQILMKRNWSGVSGCSLSKCECVHCPKEASSFIFTRMESFMNWYLQRIDFKLFCGCWFFYSWTSNMILAPANELNSLLFYIRKQLFYKRNLGLAVNI